MWCFHPRQTGLFVLALFMLAERAVAGGNKAPVPPARVASTPGEAIQLLIKAVKPLEARATGGPAAALVNLFKGVSPHLAQPSHQMVRAVLGAIRAAEAHDAEARRRFGESLPREKGYMSATDAISFMAGLCHPLMLVLPGSKAEIVKKTARSPTEVVFRVRWRKATRDEIQEAEETLVAVKEGRGWKVLLLGFTDMALGSGQSGKVRTSVARREQTEWDAGRVQVQNKDTEKGMEAMNAELEKLSRQLKEGRFSNARAYVNALNALDPAAVR